MDFNVAILLLIQNYEDGSIVVKLTLQNDILFVIDCSFSFNVLEVDYNS